MITETIFFMLLATMIIFLVVTLFFKNVAVGAFTIIINLILGWALLPSVGGVDYQSGANIFMNGTTTTIINVYSSYTNIFLATTFFLIVLYMSMNLINFRKEEKTERENAI